jgi:serine/threonine protein phosphatase 1
MIYVMSDIHGRLDLFEQMLDKIGFSDNDFLYVLGDSIDRGGGLQVLLRIMEFAQRNQCELILGNHEEMFCTMFQLRLTDSEIVKCSNELIDRVGYARKALQNNSQLKSAKSDSLGMSIVKMVAGLKNLKNSYENTNRIQSLKAMINSSMKYKKLCQNYDEWETFKNLDALSKQQRGEIFSFLNNAVAEKHIDVNGKNFILVHGGLAKERFETLTIRENFWDHPVNKTLLKEKGYPEDSVVIFGHTTTRDIAIDKTGAYAAYEKIWHDTDKIGIDCAACFPNGQLACLRLDDMQEFYVENEEKFIVTLDRLNVFLEDVGQYARVEV